MPTSLISYDMAPPSSAKLPYKLPPTQGPLESTNAYNQDPPAGEAALSNSGGVNDWVQIMPGPYLIHHNFRGTFVDPTLQIMTFANCNQD